MALKTKRVEYTEVDYQDLESLIREVYGKPDYDIVADEEWNNDSDHTFTVEPKLDMYQTQDIEQFKATGEAMYRLGTILDDLCANGHIEPGEYLISVCW